MALILYALAGQGRGHTSRSLAVVDALRARGHGVAFCCGEPAAGRLRAQGESVVPVPAPREYVRRNRVRLLRSAWTNAPLAFGTPRIVRELAEHVADLGPDLVVADFEPFAPRAAERLGVPAVALSHQQVISEARCRVPLRFAASAALTRLGIGVMAPRRLFRRIVVPSFFFPPLRDPERAVLIPPILRGDVQAAEPTRGDHVLVYLNHPDGAERVARTLTALPDVPFVAYNLPSAAAAPNVTVKSPGRAPFVADLAACRAVVCTAGFTLLSEALHLGKPVLAVPNRGFFEQAVNALYLARSGRGGAVLSGRLTPEALRGFLARAAPLALGGPVGNGRAADLVEDALRGSRRVFAPTS